MDLRDFIAGKKRKGFQYEYFLPEPVNHDWTISDALIQRKLESASLRLGELNSFARLIPDMNRFIRSYVRKEAVTSSRIEGTRTNMEQAFTDEADIAPEERDTWLEVHQYIRAMDHSLRSLQALPLSSRLIRESHRILLSHGRGERKEPGEFRKSQNWIGGATLNDAMFIPPSAEHLPDLLSDLERFMQNESIAMPNLVRVAICHYQFETIHPFLDGNGRIGRLLITLSLMHFGMIDAPLLYTSDYFEKHKTLYFDRLTLVREKNDLTSWVRFFLDAVEQTALHAARTLQEIMALRDALMTERLPKMGRQVTAGQKLLQQLFTQPVLTVKDVEQATGLTTKSANDLTRRFIDQKILHEITGKRRNRLFVFADYLQILSR